MLILKLHQTIVVVVAISFLSITFEGCSTVHVNAVQASAADDTFSKTVVALWWGGSDPVELVDCDGNGLQFVNVSTNWLYSLCTVVTLGAVVPLDIEYRCTSEPMQDGGTIGKMEEQNYER
jgi:hypothetical protein